MSLRMVEHAASSNGLDNFDIGGFQAWLVATGGDFPRACLADFSGNESCDPSQQSCDSGTGLLADTSDTGVARLSATNDCNKCFSGCACAGGQGPVAKFVLIPTSTEQRDTGNKCGPYNGAPAAQPFDSIEVIVDTYDDGLDIGSKAQADIFDKVNTLLTTAPLADGFKALANDTEVSSSGAPNKPNVTFDILGTASITFTPPGNDEWHVNGVHIVGRRKSASGQDTCLLNWVATPSSPKLVFSATFPHGSQNGQPAKPFNIGDGC